MATSGEQVNEKLDPVTGLSEKETNIVQSTWAFMTTDLVASGVEIMLSLFDAHPDYQSHFEAFKDVPRAELRNNKKLQAHGVNVMKALNGIIDGLTDTDRLVPHLEGIGWRHSKRGLNEEHFNNLSVVMIEVLRRNLRDAFTPEVEQTWRKAIAGAWSYIFKGFVRNS